MPENLQDYPGNKVTFLKWQDNGLLLAKIWICKYAMEDVRLGQ